MKRKAALAAVPVAAFALAVGPASVALAQGSSSSPVSYQATLAPQNNQSGASGMLSLTLNGSTATITEHVSGLAATFNGQPFPHVQHIHGSGNGMCPTGAADTNGDGVVSTVEGQPAYGKVLTTLSTSGDTSAAAATDIKIAPNGSSYDYSRTITLDAATMAAIQDGNAVIVVHGDDPTKLPAAAQTEKSPLVPSLPLAATAPALCGKLVAAQMTSMPAGGAATGGGSTSGIEDQGLFALGGGLIVVAVGGGLTTVRRRRAAGDAR